MDYLLHGSHTKIENGKLIPHVSFDFKPLVYATTDYGYALLRCGKFNPQDLAIKEEYDGQFITLVELREHAFMDIFNTDGWIYIVDKQNFTPSGLEYISECEVPIKIKYYIPNVMLAIALLGTVCNKFNLVYFKDCDQYFEQQGIDKAAYMERKRQRAEKLLKGTFYAEM